MCLRLMVLALSIGFAGLAAAQQPKAEETFYTPQHLEAAPAPVMAEQAWPNECLEIGPWFGGAEYRMLRAHFSEAIAFAEVNDSLSASGFNREVTARELDFDYESSMRFYLGCHLGDQQDIRFAYWYFNAEVEVNGEAAAGQYLVDPYGNVALPGSSMNTFAAVNMNVFDLEYLQTMDFSRQNVNFAYSAGLRFADIGQDYGAVMQSAGGTTLSSGIFSADFTGVGPYLSLTGSSYHGVAKQFSLVAKGGAAVLIGQYDVASGAAIPGVFSGSQSASRTRAVPVLETELGGAWRPNDRVTVTAGWLFSAWMNLGTSGGGFSGENLPVAPMTSVFGQTDDADIMSFDGLFVRTEVWF
jgi:hypothetical protein